MVEVFMKREAVLGLPEAWEIVSGEVTDQVISLTVISTQLNPFSSFVGLKN